MNDILKAVFATHAGYGITLLRVVTGLTFAAHGAQKLFAWFGGYGLAGTGQWMDSIGITPGYLMALMAGGAEFFGGLALVVGLLVRPAALSLVIAMLVAVFTVHWANGFFITANGFEYAMILGLISAVLLVEGAGKLSLDRRIAG
ncbi:DoxX family protein [Zestomonas carbonaria]|uniref:Oxidoreductase MhqP n=1 Tax=Zestomonas carbonaria TaxID=2762745 RepID=A0A7U7EPF1_9GAMM|nr:DoxX family protein [Pseudomonas carbonaria]CAD5108752.1 Putative oxidoreductase MhqP [Pseudomonas carbonaria]